MPAPRLATSVEEWDISSGTAPLLRWLQNTETAMNISIIKNESIFCSFGIQCYKLIHDHEALYIACVIEIVSVVVIYSVSILYYTIIKIQNLYRERINV